jgi:hypothetical protein
MAMLPCILFDIDQQCSKEHNTCPCTQNIDAHVFCHSSFVELIACGSKPQMQGRLMTVIYLPQLRVVSTSSYEFGKIVFLSWSPWQTIHAPRRLSTLFLMLIVNSHYLVDCHFFALFCLDISRATIHDVHRIPNSQRDASCMGIAF